MEASTLRAVERSIVAMRRNLGEQITIDDLARAAMFSKFHFTRLFQKVTGVSPARFLSALRIQEAKRLLLTTPSTVADIGHEVGYNSIGSFSSRFSNSVGLSPIAYRHRRGIVTEIPVGDPPADGAWATPLLGCADGVPPTTQAAPIFVGLFRGRIPEGPPMRYAVLHGPGSYQLPAIPPGHWYLTARSVCPTVEESKEYYVGWSGPVTTEPGVTARFADVHLHPVRITDPPHLLALPDLRSAQLRVAG